MKIILIDKQKNQTTLKYLPENIVYRDIILRGTW